MNFGSEFSSTRSENTDLNGMMNETATYLSYKLTDLDSFRFNTSVIFVDPMTNSEDMASEATWGGMTLRYKRSKILTADKNWLDMSAEVRLNAFPKWWLNGDKKFGSYSLRTNLVKEFTDKFNVFTQLRYDEYFRTSAADKLTRRKFIAIVVPSYTLMKDLVFSPEVSFAYYIYGESKDSQNTVGFSPTLSYNFSKDFSMSAYWSSDPFVSNDGKFLSPDWGKTSAFATYLSYSLF